MEFRNFLDFNSVLEALGTLEIPNTEMSCFPRSLGDDVGSCWFSSPEYTLGLWCTKTGLTIHEFGFNKIPKQVHPIDQVKAFEISDTGFSVLFKDGYLYGGKPFKGITFDLMDISKSVVF